MLRDVKGSNIGLTYGSYWMRIMRRGCESDSNETIGERERERERDERGVDAG